MPDFIRRCFALYALAMIVALFSMSVTMYGFLTQLGSFFVTSACIVDGLNFEIPKGGRLNENVQAIFK